MDPFVLFFFWLDVLLKKQEKGSKYIYHDIYIGYMKKQQKKRDRNILIRLPDDIIEESKEKAEELNLTRTAYLRLVLTRFFKEVDK